MSEAPKEKPKLPAKLKGECCSRCFYAKRKGCGCSCEGRYHGRGRVLKTLDEYVERTVEGEV